MKNKSVLYLALAILVLTVLFVLFKPKPTPTKTNDLSSSTPVEEASASVDPEINLKRFDIRVQNNKVVFGLPDITVTEGDEVSIAFTSDVDEELHLHGYEKVLTLSKDTTVELRFVANLTGRFPFEFHKSDVEIGVIEVLPRK